MSFPIERLDDLTLFGVWALLVVCAYLAGASDQANSLASGWMGAAAMYLKGKA
jgi:hypothetical protein